MECNVYLGVRKPTLISGAKIKKVVFFVLKKLNMGRGELSVNLISEKEIKHLNLLYRKKEKVTDVLSFSIAENKNSEELGDIFLCPKQIIRQAKEFKIRPEEEAKRMLVHGVMHLLGFEHQNKKAEREMFAVQEEMLKEMMTSVIARNPPAGG